jgi:hypothetical protein
MARARRQPHRAHATTAAVRRAFAGLVCIVAFLVGGLRAPSIGTFSFGLPSAEIVEGAPRANDPAIEEQDDSGRAPVIRSSQRGKPGGAARLRVAEGRALYAEPASSRAWLSLESDVTRRGSAGAAWRPRARTRAELMVFLN